MDPKEKTASIKASVKICHDRREPLVILNSLKLLGAELEKSQLPAGDYIVGDDCVIERKDINDFVNSIIDLRLFDQARRMKKSFGKVIVVVEGAGHERNMHESSFYGALVSLVTDYGISVVSTKTMDETAKFIFYTAKHIQASGDNARLPRVKGQKKTNTVEELQRAVVESLPGIGPKTAVKLLEVFGSVRGLASSNVEQLSKIEGVGMKRAKDIHETFNKKYSLERDRLSEVFEERE